jgi:hypothetical protein
MPPVTSSNHPDTPFYRYDPNLGSTRDEYTRADLVHPEARGPEVAGIFVANVEGETMINTMWGRRIVPWHAEPGTPCIILGYWSDGSVHVQWPAISGQYRVDGRFPAWVVASDPTATLAGGGRILPANDPPALGRGLSNQVILLIAAAFVLLALLAVPQVRDAIGALLAELMHGPR